ncbi:MAG: hypothetical protein RLZ26_2609, partial [Pseudomonadota bacterium]
MPEAMARIPSAAGVKLSSHARCPSSSFAVRSPLASSAEMRFSPRA